MNKVCSSCNQEKDKIKDFSDRQRTKKFGKCNACLAPTHASQGYVPSLAADKCKRCHGPLVMNDRPAMDNSLCYLCSIHLEFKGWRREENALIAKQREQEAKDRKYKAQKRKEKEGESVLDLLDEGVRLNYQLDGNFRFGADD